MQTVREQVKALSDGNVTAQSLVEQAESAIGDADSSVNAVVAMLPKMAREYAKRADERRAQGDPSPLLGVPIAVKDDQDIAGHLTGRGSRAFTSPATAHSPGISALLDAGVVPVAKTTLPELAIFGFTNSAATGITRNPHDQTRTSGGSSGGSAALVASGAIPIATGSDGAGSLRIPAASCGTVGFKPTQGRMPGSGGWFGMSTQGVLTTTVTDTALYLDAVGRFDQSLVAASAQVPDRLRIGVTTNPASAGRAESLDPQLGAEIERVAGLLSRLGHTVRPVHLRYGLAARSLTVRYLAGIRHEAAQAEHRELLEERTRGIARWGRPFTRGVIDTAIRAGARWGAAVHDLHGVDVLLSPVMTNVAAPVDYFEGKTGLGTVLAMNAYYPFTAQWNHAGIPAVALPTGQKSGRLPLSVQLVGRGGDDARVMSLAGQLEGELGQVPY